MSEVDAYFRISKDVRYVALYLDGQLTLHARPGLVNASASESDKYEELIVNPALLLLVRQRGNIDCGGAQFIIIRYGNFWQMVWPVANGHLSLGLEPSANPLDHVRAIQAALAKAAL